MASAKFLEDALSENVDESAVNAIVGSLENDLTTLNCSLSSQNNIGIVNQSYLGNVSSGSSIIGAQNYSAKHSNSNYLKTENYACSAPNSSVYSNVQVQSMSYDSQSKLSVAKSNEGVQIIYSPSSQAISSPITSNIVTFSTQSLPHGIVPGQNVIHTVPGSLVTRNPTKCITMQQPLVIKQGSTTGQVGIQPGMVTGPMTVNSSMPGSIPNVMILTKQGQNVVATSQNMGGTGQTSLMPNVQILNMGPGAPRAFIGTQQVVGARAASAPITLQTLQGLQPGQQGLQSGQQGLQPGQQGHWLLKTENGQYQLLRVGPAPAAAAGTLAAPQAQTLRLPTVPAITLQTLQGLQPGQQGLQSGQQGLQPGQQGHWLLKTENGQYQLLRVGPAPAAAAGTLAAPQAQTLRLPTVPAITLQTLQGLQPGQQGLQSGQQGLQPGQQGHWLLKTENGQYQLLRVGPAPAAAAGTLAAPQAQTLRLPTVPAHLGSAMISTAVAAPQQMPSLHATPGVVASIEPHTTQIPTVTTQKPSDNMTEKCSNFLANLLYLSSKEPTSVERNVRNLIQKLIDAHVEPEEFCDRLERLINASPQPRLIGFLKKSLPLLRQSLVTKELVLEGINSPAPHIAFPNIPAPVQQTRVSNNIQMKMASAKFLEDALSTNVDESAVNAIVGSLENQLVTSSCSSSSQNNVGIVNQSHLVNVSGGSSIIGVQKYIANHSSSNELKTENYACSVPNSSVYSNVHAAVQNHVQSLSNVSQSKLSVAKSNEGVKIIYSPSSQAISSPVTSNRVTFSTQSLPNGIIPGQNVIHTVPGSLVSQNVTKGITMQQPLVIKQGTTTGQVGIQPGMVTVPMTVNSSMPGSIPNVMTLTKQGQNVVATSQNMGGTGQPSLMPNVQILNMRPGAPGVAAQKSVATVSPRVVIGTQQVVGARAASAPITLQTLQGLQPGQQGHLLLKTENGQYQLLRVGPAPAAAAGTLAAPQAQTLRLSTVPAHPGVATVSTAVAAPQQMPAPQATPVVAASVAPPITQTPTVTTQKPSDNTKEKCRNFLANLLDLSSKEPKSVERNVRNLIQELIDAQVEPEEFCDRLERLLNASPQPCLIGFLKKSLPLLRQSLVTKELVIEGINSPAPHIAFSNIPAPVQQTIVSNNIQMTEANATPPTLTTLLPAMLPVATPTLVQTVQPGKTINIISASQIQPAQVLSQQQQQSKPTPKPGSSIAVLQNIPIQTQQLKINKVSSPKNSIGMNKAAFNRPMQSASLNTVLTPGKSLLRDKEKKTSSQFSSQQFADDKMAGDDDINDVAAMGGVNLAEESQRILGSTELIGTQIRSCKDEFLVPLGVMQARLKAAAAKHGLEEPSAEVTSLVSHAVHERLKNLLEKLAVTAQHRIDMLIKTDPRYEVTQDVKGQVKFLEELDRVEKKRREDSEREMLMRAAKSRSKNEDPEQAKLKAKAKEMQRAEMEEMRQREANLTALQAIGPRKKPKLEGPGGAGDNVTSGPVNGAAFNGRSQMALRTRLKRINQRDLVFLLEQERETSRSATLYRSYLK